MVYDAVVVGAGVAGLSAARALALRGMRRVLVLERGILAGQSSTARAAGAIFSGLWSEESVRLVLRTQAILTDLAGRSGGMLLVRRIDHLLLVSAAQRPEAERIARLVVAAGGEARLIGPDEARALFPAIQVDDVAAAVHNTHNVAAHPAQVLMALAAQARAEGVTCLEGAAVERLHLSGSRVSGVVVKGEVVPARHVVLAAGMATRRILQASGLDIPLKPFRTEASVVPVPAGITLPGLTDALQGMYGVPRVQGGFLVGYGTRTVGIDPDRWDPEADPEEEAAALARLARRVPALAGQVPVGGWAGICDITPDNLPLMGRFGPDGLHLFCGLAGHGVSRAPAAAEVLADWITDREPALDLSPFRASRYEGWNGADFPVRFTGPWRISVSVRGEEA